MLADDKLAIADGEVTVAAPLPGGNAAICGPGLFGSAKATAVIPIG